MQQPRSSCWRAEEPPRYWLEIAYSRRLAILVADDQARLAEDAEVLGDVVLGNAEALRQIVDGQRLLQQGAHDAEAAFIGQGFKDGDPLIFFNHLVK